jgi:hypothetical protein
VARSPFLVGAGSERERATRMGIARMCVGGMLLVTTGLTRRLFGIPVQQDNAALRAMARLAGVRNIVLGAWALAARDQERDERRLCYQLNAATDCVDLGILAVGGLTGEGLWRGVAMGCALGGSAMLAWLDLIQEADAGDP